MRLLFIRHAEPDYDNDTITEKGKREAALLARYMKDVNVTAFYCSPLGRAKDTAAATLELVGRDAQICDWLREFPGYTCDKDGVRHIPWDRMPGIWTKEPRYYDRDRWYTTPLMKSGDNTVETCYKTVCGELDGLLSSYGYRREGNYYRVERENHDTLAFFCHFAVTCVMASHLLGIATPLLWHGFATAPTSITTFYTEERQQGIGYFRCTGFGDVSHLYAQGEPASFSARFCEAYSDADSRH